MMNRNFISNIYIVGIILLMCINLEVKSQCPSALDFDVSGALCINGNVLFENISSSSPGGTFEFKVEGNLLKNAPYSYVFTTAGAKIITLTRTDPNGCTTEKIESVEIGTFPVAGFSFSSDNNNPPCSSNPIQFTDNSIPGDDLSYSWDFGKGNTSIEKNPNTILEAIGNGVGIVNVKLTVTTQNGCAHSIAHNVSVEERPEIILTDEFGDQIEEFENCEEASPITPDMHISFSSNTSPDGSIYQVDWGDGTPEYNETYPPSSHSYSDMGVHVMTYLVTGTNGCQFSRKINAFNISNPSIGGGNPGNTVGCSPLSVTFPITGFEKNDTTTTYEIDPGDDSGIHKYSHPPPSEFLHVYTTTSCGQENDAFTFKIVASNGCKSTPFETSAIEVHTTPLADFTVENETACINQNAEFTNATLEGFNSLCKKNTRYEWNFGDGSDVVELFKKTTVSHQYTTAGIYNVTLSAFNTCGTSTITKPITICDEQPISSFKINGEGILDTSSTDCTKIILPTETCPPVFFTLNNETNGTCNDTYSWTVISKNGGFEFSNGKSSSDSQNETITFSKGGSYTIQHTVMNACGSTSTCIQLEINQAPETPVITGGGGDYCEGDLVDLNAASNGVIEDIL